MEYLGLIICTLTPAIFTIILYFIDKKTKFGNLKPLYKELIIGSVFGILAVLGTHFGIPINGAQVNCRDAAVLTASFFFGWKAGILAGLIGGIERWFSVYFGVGYFTRVACSISTILAGFFGALIRKYMLKDKKPGWLLAFVMAVVMETIHMIMVFITNFNKTPNEAMSVVRSCTPFMLGANGLSVLISGICLTLISKERMFKRKDAPSLIDSIQKWMLISVCGAFVLSNGFVYLYQNRLALDTTETNLRLASTDIVNDVKDKSDRNLLNITIQIRDEIVNYTGVTDNSYLNELNDKYTKISEISIVNNQGIIINSTDLTLIDFDFHCGEQAEEFITELLINNNDTFVQKYGPISMDSNIYRKYAGVKYNDGFIQVGYNMDTFEKDVTKLIDGVADNRHIGDTGFVMVIDSNDKVVNAPKNKEIDDAFGVTFVDNELHTIQLNGKEYYVLYLISEGYKVLSLITTNEALKVELISLYVNTFLEIIIFSLLFVLIYVLIRKRITEKIDKINVKLDSIAQGNLNEVVDVRDNVEFIELSDDINKTVDTLKKYINEAEKRMEKELELAKNIQLAALPTVDTTFDNRVDFDIYASMNAAKEVGGDFYDFYFTDENTLNILVADVSGKGIPAAMFMMRAKAILKALTEKGLPVDEVFTLGNKALCEANDAQMFITCWQAKIDLKSGHVTYVNAGHNPPLVKTNGKYEYLKGKSGFVLAGFDGFVYKSQEFDLNSGDYIYLYTDGVTEATNSNNELFSEERLIELLNANEFDSCKDLCENIKSHVDEFQNDREQFDDITMLSFQYKGLNKDRIMEEENTSIEDISKFVEFAENVLNELNAPMKDIIKINIAIDEIVSNIFKYGYDNKPGYVKMKIRPSVDLKYVSISFYDRGVPYNPIKAEDPDVTMRLEDRAIGGLGIYVVKKTMDNMKYKYENGQNILTIKKIFTKE